jgi:TetR/AcrR family transcriptional regulator, cholesterol catabolism regulator
MQVRTAEDLAIQRVELQAQEHFAKFADSDRWEKILYSAADLFARKGYAATSFQDLADEVGMLRGSFYHYVKSKADLLFYVLYLVHDVDYSADVDPAASAPDKVRSFVRTHLQNSVSRRDWATLFSMNIAALTPDQRALILAKRRSVDEELRALLREGQAEGTVRPDLDVKLVSIAILTVVNSLYLWFDEERGDLDKVAATLEDLFENGFGGSAGESA